MSGDLDGLVPPFRRRKAHAISADQCNRRRSPYTNAFLAFVSSLAPSDRPRCHAPYSAHEWDSRYLFAMSAWGCVCPSLAVMEPGTKRDKSRAPSDRALKSERTRR